MSKLIRRFVMSAVLAIGAITVAASVALAGPPIGGRSINHNETIVRG